MKVDAPGSTRTATRLKQYLLLGLLGLHFTVGLLTFLPAEAAPRQWPLVGSLLDLYSQMDFQQTWRMFAPPSQAIQEVGVAAKLDGGWTPLSLVNDRLRAEVQGRWWQPLPRGMIRLANHLRPPELEKASLDEDPEVKFYYRELAHYFCAGQGRIAGAHTVRLYLVTHGIEPFYPTDEHGKPVASAAQRSSTKALYERDCGEST